MNGEINEVGTPSVGTPVTVRIGSDRYGGTVVEVSPTGHIVKVQINPSRGGHIHEVGKGDVRNFTRRKDGRYRASGVRTGISLTFGRRITDLDPSF